MPQERTPQTASYLQLAKVVFLNKNCKKKKRKIGNYLS